MAPQRIESDEELSDPTWVDDRNIVFETLSKDFKTHSILVSEIGQLPRRLQSDTDPKFWSMAYQAGSAPLPSPDGKWLIFISDRDGWDHLYVMPAKGGPPIQLTHGKFEAWRPRWSHDSRRIAFDANLPDHPGDRQIFVADINNASAIRALTSGEGTNTEPHWSPDDKSLVFQHTDTQHAADLFIVATSGDARPLRLTNSMPPELANRHYVKPEFVHFEGAGGQQVPGWLFLPPNFDRSKKYPAILWIHGDGINQNYNGWHVEHHYDVYYSFHQYLLEQGYVVFAPDYRGSTGYGRDWRQGVYLDVGGNDAKDAWMGGRYLASLPYVDRERIGVWGLSYGGFFTLIAMTDQPTLFRAGVDVAGVVDYRMYYADPYHGGWTVKPHRNAGAKSASLRQRFTDLPHRPSRTLRFWFNALHGRHQRSLRFESVALIDESLKKAKYAARRLHDVISGEFHYFDCARASSLLDAFLAARQTSFSPKMCEDYRPNP